MMTILFSAGFRVFFPLGALGAVLLLPYWVLLVTGHIDYLPSHFSPAAWHQHEMIFGVFAPIIIGFLFTAVPNWTGVASPRGMPLLLLLILWFLGRLCVFFGGILPPFLPMVVDFLLLPLAIMGIAPAIFKTGNKRNYFLPIMLMVFAIFNLCSHLSAIDVIAIDENNFFIAALLFVVMLMNVIGGRVAPNFLKSKYPNVKQFTHKSFLPMSMLSIAATMIFILFDGDATLIGLCALLAGIFVLIRLLGWHGWVAVSDPLMIILHIGILWIAIGFFLMSYAYFVAYGFILLSFHAFSIGAAGSLTLGMMSRAIIGHSGRPINNDPLITTFLVLINIAAISRIVAPLVMVDYYRELLFISGFCWVMAYLLFLIRFIPMVIKPRVT